MADFKKNHFKSLHISFLLAYICHVIITTRMAESIHLSNSLGSFWSSHNRTDGGGETATATWARQVDFLGEIPSVLCRYYKLKTKNGEMAEW